MPSPLLRRTSDEPEASLTTFTSAPGIDAGVASTILPVNVLVPTCAASGATRKIKSESFGDMDNPLSGAEPLDVPGSTLQQVGCDFKHSFPASSAGVAQMQVGLILGPA